MKTKLRIKISKGNMKLGKVHNISLPPIVTCREDAPCKKDCYAVRSFRMYPNTRKAWQTNLDIYNDSPELFFAEINTYLHEYDIKRFRWHVAGDIVDQRYLDGIVRTAIIFNKVEFLLFTKKYDLDYGAIYKATHNMAHEFVSDTRNVPNLAVIFSAWPGMEAPNYKYDFPVAWLSTDDRSPVHNSFPAQEYYKCVGHCGECGHRCWDVVKNKIDIVFDLH